MSSEYCKHIYPNLVCLSHGDALLVMHRAVCINYSSLYYFVDFDGNGPACVTFVIHESSLARLMVR